MFYLYVLIFWIPAFASAILLWLTWSDGLLHRPLLAGSWFLAALLLQAGSGLMSPVWGLGLLMQTGLAVYLLMRRRIGY